MPFTPEEIENKEFLTTLRGFDKDEVGMFLRAVASDYRAALEDSSSTKNSRRSAATERTSAGAEVKGMLDHSRKEADRVRAEAHAEAKRLKADAEKQAAAIKKEATTLRDQQQQRLKATEEEAALRLGKLKETERDFVKRIRELETALRKTRESFESDLA